MKNDRLKFKMTRSAIPSASGESYEILRSSRFKRDSLRMTRGAIFAFCIVILIFTFLFLIFGKWRAGSTNKLDDFAQCLTAKGVVMYGAEWCPHCQNEKKAFGNSFKYISYVECPDDPQKCIAEGIRGYPTWIFPDGRRFEGEQGINKLSEISGCSLTD